jgi:hypothetical protein
VYSNLPILTPWYDDEAALDFRAGTSWQLLNFFLKQIAETQRMTSAGKGIRSSPIRKINAKHLIFQQISVWL